MPYKYSKKGKTVNKKSYKPRRTKKTKKRGK
jgi:hypothetical protein